MNVTSVLVSAESVKAKLKKEALAYKKDFDFLLLHYFNVPRKTPLIFWKRW
jgi:hypothetical protein